MKLETTILLVFLFMTLSCKKTVEPEEPTAGNTAISSTEQLIRHNWTFVYSILNDYGANPGSDTIHAQPGDYYIFDANNKAYAFWDNVHDTISYQVLSASRMLYGGDTVEINTLNTTDFVFTNRVKNSSNDYENVIRMTR